MTLLPSTLHFICAFTPKDKGIEIEVSESEVERQFPCSEIPVSVVTWDPLLAKTIKLLFVVYPGFPGKVVNVDADDGINVTEYFCESTPFVTLAEEVVPKVTETLDTFKLESRKTM